MQYRVEYDIIGVESGASGFAIFEADNDEDAIDDAREIVKDLESECNDAIDNVAFLLIGPFWYLNYKITGVYRVPEEETLEPVPL